MLPFGGGQPCQRPPPARAAAAHPAAGPKLEKVFCIAFERDRTSSKNPSVARGTKLALLKATAGHFVCQHAKT